jgi:hypothetical protein
MKVELIEPVSAPPMPVVRLCLGVTGHREDNPAFTANRAAIVAALEQVLDEIDAAVVAEHHGPIAPTRLHCLLADGTDQVAAESALARGWDLIAPLPFGLALNAAINAHPVTEGEARALLFGTPGDCDDCSAELRERAHRIRALAAQARLFELADRDDAMRELFLEKLRFPNDGRKAATFVAESSLRVALAGRVMIEQSDILVAVWDGLTRALIGGTGHTIQIALETGASVIWIDTHQPDRWRILSGPESLAGLQAGSHIEDDRSVQLRALVRNALNPAEPQLHHKRHRRHAPPGPEVLAKEAWPVRSNPAWHLYRRVEALFGADDFRSRFRNLRVTYETPDAIATRSAAGPLALARALPGQLTDYMSAIETGILRRFAWADGISARLSDVYRGGMTLNFLLAPLAIVGGIAYLTFATSEEKWLFALFELTLLAAVLAIVLIGQSHRWHKRWFETRRVAEYLRHAPILQLFGVARAPGRWPMGTETSWPEWYARHALREVGLPHLVITQPYLRRAVTEILWDHVKTQRDYHIAKARRLAAVHHNLDRFATALFALAIVSVMGYLILKGGGAMHTWRKEIAEHLSYLFTFLGVLLPTFGAAISSIRFFGDFERFAAISRVTAEKLHSIHTRIDRLLAAPEGALDYGRAADLAHATDDVVVSEIESWQSVFGGKQVTVPV